MRPSRRVACANFPCRDVRPECYSIPGIDVKPAAVSVVMISEAVPPDPCDYFYARGKP